MPVTNGESVRERIISAASLLFGSAVPPTATTTTTSRFAIAASTAADCSGVHAKLHQWHGIGDTSLSCFIAITGPIRPNYREALHALAEELELAVAQSRRNQRPGNFPVPKACTRSEDNLEIRPLARFSPRAQTRMTMTGTSSRTPGSNITVWTPTTSPRRRVNLTLCTRSSRAAISSRAAVTRSSRSRSSSTSTIRPCTAPPASSVSPTNSVYLQAIPPMPAMTEPTPDPEPEPMLTPKAPLDTTASKTPKRSLTSRLTPFFRRQQQSESQQPETLNSRHCSAGSAVRQREEQQHKQGSSRKGLFGPRSPSWSPTKRTARAESVSISDNAPHTDWSHPKPDMLAESAPPPYRASDAAAANDRSRLALRPVARRESATVRDDNGNTRTSDKIHIPTRTVTRRQSTTAGGISDRIRTPIRHVDERSRTDTANHNSYIPLHHVDDGVSSAKDMLRLNNKPVDRSNTFSGASKYRGSQYNDMTSAGANTRASAASPFPPTPLSISANKRAPAAPAFFPPKPMPPVPHSTPARTLPRTYKPPPYQPANTIRLQRKPVAHDSDGGTVDTNTCRLTVHSPKKPSALAPKKSTAALAVAAEAQPHQALDSDSSILDGPVWRDMSDLRLQLTEQQAADLDRETRARKREDERKNQHQQRFPHK